MKGDKKINQLATVTATKWSLEMLLNMNKCTSGYFS